MQRPPRLSLTCALILTTLAALTHPSQAANDSAQNVSACPETSPSPQLWVTDCCDIWAALQQFTVEKTGSQIALAHCKQQVRCSDLKLVEVFVQQSRVLLSPAAVQYVDAHRIQINLTDTKPQKLLNLLALAFVGRQISVSDIDVGSQVQLIYDIQTDRFNVNRPVCQYSKGIYNSMVLASVVLLIFFIAMQIIEQAKAQQTQEQQKQKQAPYASPPQNHKITLKL